MQPVVRRFLLDHGVTWSTVFNGQRDRDFAAEYSVREIPANILIGRDGRVVGIDLRAEDLGAAIAKALKNP